MEINYNMRMVLTLFVLCFVSLFISSFLRGRKEVFDGLLTSLYFGFIGFIIILIAYLIRGVL